MAKKQILFKVDKKGCEGYQSGFGVINSRLIICDFLQFIGYYNKENKVLTCYSYCNSGLDITLPDEDKLTISYLYAKENIFDATEYDYQCHDSNYIIKDFVKFLNKKFCIKVLKEGFCLKTLYDISAVKNWLQNYFNEFYEKYGNLSTHIVSHKMYIKFDIE